MSKALSVLKLFFSLVSINSTETQSSVNRSTGENTPSPTTAVITMSPPVNGTAFVGQAFRFSVPRVSRLQLSMKTEHNGDIGPSSWIQFDKNRREVYGFPLPGNTGVFTYKLVVNDEGKAFNKVGRTIFFKLNVQRSDFSQNHEVVLQTDTNFQKFMTQVNMRIDFVTRLSRYSFNEKPSVVWIKSFVKDTRELTVVFTNIPSSSCDEDLLSKLKSSMVDDESKVKKQFQTALTAQFPIESVRFKLFAPCDVNMFEPDPPFNWGWLEHFLPIVIMLCVVGIPVLISVLVNKFRTKPPVVAEPRRTRTLGRRKEGDTDLSFHTVHFNNRYPSMPSISNNSKEDHVGEEDKAYSGRVNIPNGNASGRTLAVPNATPKRPRKGAADEKVTKNPSANRNNPFKFPIKDRSSINIRAMWDSDDDEERPQLNIPVYYTYRNTEEEPSMLDAVLDMNFSNLADNISSKLKGFKSMLNVSQGQSGEQDSEQCTESTSVGPSLTSKLKGFGKSMLNVPLGSNEPTTAASSAAETSSLAAKLKGFGKSMLNISLGAQGEDSKPDGNTTKQQTSTYDDSDDSDSFIYKPREYNERATERQEYRLSGDESSEYELSRYASHRPSIGSDCEFSRYSDRRSSTSSDYYERTRENFDDYYEITQEQYDDFYETTREQGDGYYETAREPYDDYYEATRKPHDDYYETTREQYQDYEDGDFLVSEPTNFVYKDSTEAFTGATYVQHCENCDQEKSIFDTDFCEFKDEELHISKQITTGNPWPPNMAQDDTQIQSESETTYHEYTNPSGYCNGPTRVIRSKSTHNVLGTTVSNQSSFDFWGEEEHDRKKTGNDFIQGKAYVFSSFTMSAPDISRKLGKGSHPDDTKAKNRAKYDQESFLLSDIDSSTQTKPAVDNRRDDERDSSVVGFIKTRVSSLLDSEGNVSKWFSGFQKSDSGTT